MLSLRTVRRRAGLSQPQLAHLSGINQATISLLERGRICGPRTTTVHAIARALRVTDATVIAALAASVRQYQLRQRRRIARIRTTARALAGTAA